MGEDLKEYILEIKEYFKAQINGIYKENEELSHVI